MSIGTLYVEREIAEHPRTRQIAARFPNAVRVACDRYGEVFNRRAQSFRLQKRRPALILAQKHDRLVHETPPGYGIGTPRNFYFSHMWNCVYDCRYCFLQGMYRSAHYVVFINFEDFFDAIEETAAAGEDAATFFSGYDCDSLAFDGVTGFVETALPVFERLGERAWLELRTKSTRTGALLATEALPNVVVAFSFTPAEVSVALEDGVPTVERRIAAMVKLARRGWRLGLRFDPLIYTPDFRDRYDALFAQIFAAIDAEHLHSVSLGPFRLPKTFFRRMERLYPDEPLFAGPLEDRGGMVSYRRALEAEMVGEVTERLARRVPAEIFFPCALPDG